MAHPSRPCPEAPPVDLPPLPAWLVRKLARSRRSVNGHACGHPSAETTLEIADDDTETEEESDAVTIERSFVEPIVPAANSVTITEEIPTTEVRVKAPTVTAPVDEVTPPPPTFTSGPKTVRIRPALSPSPKSPHALLRCLPWFLTIATFSFVGVIRYLQVHDLEPNLGGAVQAFRDEILRPKKK